MIKRGVHWCRGDKWWSVMAFYHDYTIHSLHGCGLGLASKRKKKKNSHEIRRQKWSSHQVQNVNLKSGVTAVITQCHGTLGSLAWGSNWAYSSFSSCQSSTFAFPNNTGAGLCAAPWWGVPHLLQITYIIKVEGYLHHQGCRCGSSESHESSSLGS